MDFVSDRILAVMVPLSVTTVILGILFGIDRCSTRENEFKMKCIEAGGTYIEGKQSHCIINGKVKTSE